MIGIAILDNLSDEELVAIALRNKIIRVPKKIPIQLVIDYNSEPQLNQFEEMDNEKVITMCRIEIESRLGWMYLKELIDKVENK